MMNNGARKVPRIMKKPVRKEQKDFERHEETIKLRNEGFEVQSGVLTVNMNHPAHFKPKVLPGTANEVESYPCPFCRDRVFLTASGLEKHGRELHQNDMPEILTRIASISTEWKKREFEQMRSRERSTMDRIRHEARAAELIRNYMNQDNDNDTSGDRFEACSICNVLINASHPSAMESHQKAHEKNDQLRMNLLEQFGPEIVQRLTCESCSLVFQEDTSLQKHIANHHARKKKYICKFCGQILPSLTELNLHKSDVHNYVLNGRSAIMSENWSTVSERYVQLRRYPKNPVTGRRTRKRMPNEMNNTVEGPSNVQMGQISDGDVPCRIHCPDCSLVLNRPVLLIKHMRRVHSKTIFSSFVESGGLPTFRIDFEEMGLFWNCCSMKFDNRVEFIEHRRMHIPQDRPINMHHQEPTTSSAMADTEEIEDMEDPNYEGQIVEAPDGSMQVIIPGGMDVHGNVYVVFDSNYEGEKSANKVRLVRSNNRDIVHEDGLIEEGDEDGEHQIMEQHGEVITVTQDQFDQMQMQMGGWDNMNVMLVHGDEVLEDEDAQEVVEEVVVGDNDVDGVCIDETGGNGNTAQINGTPLFD